MISYRDFAFLTRNFVGYRLYVGIKRLCGALRGGGVEACLKRRIACCGARGTLGEEIVVVWPFMVARGLCGRCGLFAWKFVCVGY